MEIMFYGKGSYSVSDKFMLPYLPLIAVKALRSAVLETLVKGMRVTPANTPTSKVSNGCFEEAIDCSVIVSWPSLLLLLLRLERLSRPWKYWHCVHPL